MNRRDFIDHSFCAASLFALRSEAHQSTGQEKHVPRELPILVFDVNETLLSLSTFAPFFSRTFGTPDALHEWFDKVVVYNLTLTLTRVYLDSSTVAVRVLRMMAQERKRTLTSEDLEEFKRVAASQPVYEDVRPALVALKQQGFRLVTLSNNSTHSTNEALSRNGILDLFERTFSIDDQVHRYKPALESYEVVAEALGVNAARLCLVSCHAFDVFGAAAAGWQTVMITRPGNAPIDLGKRPDIVATDLKHAAEEIRKRFSP